jgi:ligand-binding SRPBCC domain-containing protein
MPSIHLTTFIEAPYERVFDLSRSINLHRISLSATNEKAVDGLMNGLVQEGDTVVWEADHLRRKRKFEDSIIALQYPHHYSGEMLKGDFSRFIHHHHFKPAENGTIMIDSVEFESPYGLLGKLLDRFYLKNYIEQLLTGRNLVIKEYAESAKWKAILLR